MADGTTDEQVRTLTEQKRRLERRLTEQSRLNDKRAEQLRALAVELVHAEQLERRRVANMLHDDLQQLLVLAKMRLEQLWKGASQEAAPEIKQCCVDLERAIRASRDLVTHLSPAVLHEGGLGAAIEWLAGDYRRRHALEVELELETAEPASEAVRVFLYHAINELLFNVVKHAGTRQAMVRMHRSGDQVEIHIEDRGRGMPAERAQENSPGGMGLRRIGQRLEVLGGQMSVDSTPGQGTRTVLRAPLRAAGSKVLEHGVRLEDGSKLVVDAEHMTTLYEPDVPRRIRVLIADDHQLFREGLASLLSDKDGLEVVGNAPNGQLAVQLSSSLHPEVVVLDAEMPVVDGIEATRKIRAAEPRIRIVLLSMHDDPETRRAAEAAGVAAFLSKDEHPTTLVETIRRIVGARTA